MPQSADAPARRYREEPWAAFGALVVQREAAIARTGRGGPPRDFAGLYIGDEDVDRVLSELPGHDGPSREAADGVAGRFSTAIDGARAALHGDLEEPATLFGALCWNAGIDPEAAEALAVVAAVELDPRLQRLIAYTQDQVSLNRPTLWFLERIFGPGHAGATAFGADAPVARAAVTAIIGDGPWGTRMVRLEEPVAWALAGDRSLDPELPDGVEVARSPSGDGSAGLVVVSGGDATSRRRAAMDRLAGETFLITPMPADAAAWRAVIREATVAGLAVIVEVGDEVALPAAAASWMHRTPHLNWGIGSAHELTLESLPNRPWVDVAVSEEPAPLDDWEQFGIEPAPEHPLDRDQLRLAAKAYAAVGDDLDAAVRRLASGHLDRLATRIRPRRTWDDLVLPPEQAEQLHELTSRYRHRPRVYGEWGYRPLPSQGIVALFAGQSGTGKTLAAEIIAGDLGMDVYKIDLSSVVSKYIGETEKNLEAVFSAAAAGNVVLFFDEADSLFGKRSEVQDAHDRYANIEVSYLLQRLERYDGFVVMATNLMKNIDQAFLRRIHAAIEFPMPEPAEREQIWRLSFPKGAPTSDLDLVFLARQFDLAGGSIRNAALAAAFLAAAEDTAIEMRHVMVGLKREFQKIGRLRVAEDFEEYFDLVKGGD